MLTTVAGTALACPADAARADAELDAQRNGGGGAPSLQHDASDTHSRHERLHHDARLLLRGLVVFRLRLCAVIVVIVVVVVVVRSHERSQAET